MKQLLNTIVEKIVNVKKMEAVKEYTEKLVALIEEKEQLVNELYLLVVGQEEEITELDTNKGMSIEEMAFMNIMRAIETKVAELLVETQETVENEEIEAVEEQQEVSVAIPRKTLYDTRIAKENNDMNTHYDNTRILNIWAKDNNIDWRELHQLINNSTKVDEMDIEEKEVIDNIKRRITETEEKYDKSMSYVMAQTHLDFVDLIDTDCTIVKEQREEATERVKEIEQPVTEPITEEVIEQPVEEVAVTKKDSLVIDGYSFPDETVRDRYLMMKDRYKGRSCLEMQQMKMFNQFQKYKK